MPSPKAFLRDIHDFDLNPKKSYTKDDIGPDGRIKATNEPDQDVVEESTPILPIQVDTKDEPASTSVSDAKSLKPKFKSNPVKQKLVAKPAVTTVKDADTLGESNSGKNTVKPSGEKSESDHKDGSA